MPNVVQPLDHWLRWLETIHPTEIEMGLTRVSAVADRLGLRPANKPLILVGGTNGKGSTVAMLSAIYTQAGYRVGSYTSPHIEHFCERIKIGRDMASEQCVVEALSFVEGGRAPDTLTYFEYTTLAAMHVFMKKQCDVLLFEVGLGGRLDATNIWDADCSIVTSIARDHEAYLGSDLSVIATEKAAIGRSRKPLIVGDSHPPASLFHFAKEQGMQVHHVGADAESDLPVTAMAGAHQQRNAGCAVAAVAALSQQLPVSNADVVEALASVQVSARFERMEFDGIRVVMDVAHNPAGAQALLEAWTKEFGAQQCELVFAVLSDKDIVGIVSALQPIAAQWHCFDLDVPRATPVAELDKTIKSLEKNASVVSHESAESAWRSACGCARKFNRAVLVVGSFHTISDIREQMTTSA